MVKELSIGFITTVCLLIAGCDREYEHDNTPIDKNNFAMIQLETNICRNSVFEYSCLKHLKARIQ